MIAPASGGSLKPGCTIEPNKPERAAPLLFDPSKGAVQNPATGSVVSPGPALKVFGEGNSMKAKPLNTNIERIVAEIVRRRRARRHDPMLVLNMSAFNFTGGWRRTFAKPEYARAWA
jgi:hypothetical protein